MFSRYLTKYTHAVTMYMFGNVVVYVATDLELDGIRPDFVEQERNVNSCGSPPTATALLREMAINADTNPDFLARIGALMLRDGEDRETALEYLVQAVSLDPEEPNLRYCRGAMFYFNSMIPEARRDWASVLDLSRAKNLGFRSRLSRGLSGRMLKATKKLG